MTRTRTRNWLFALSFTTFMLSVSFRLGAVTVLAGALAVASLYAAVPPDVKKVDEVDDGDL